MNLSDLKIYTLNASALAISMSQIDIALKVILLSVSIGYTVHKWYLMHGKSK